MQNNIRNFAIIAHIDHGKSTLADRLLELTGTVKKRDMQEQMLDSNPIERERGITIKLAPVRMMYRSRIMNQESRIMGKSNRASHDSSFNIHDSNPEYILNLIDTPGHVDFSYEVSRSLAACEGALLVVDATQGVQAQTLANLRQAREHNLTIIPIINKIDLPNARIEETARELEALGFPPISSITPISPICISAKTGQNVDKVLEAIVARIPPPTGDPDAPLRALVFSSQYDIHKGVIVFVRVVDGSIQTFKGETLQGVYSNQLQFLASGVVVSPIDIGYFLPVMSSRSGPASPAGRLEAGEVGYIATGLKDIRFAKVGDTITFGENLKSQITMTKQGQHLPSKIQNEKFKVSSLHFTVGVRPLPGYKEPKPMVFLGLFPIDSDQITEAREAMERLRLSDSAFTFRPISSLALGNGFHCGFLGLLHAEIVQERLQREFNLSMIATASSVEYQISLKRSHLFRLAGEKYQVIQSASEYPDPSIIEEVREPVMQVTIFSPKRYIGPIMQLTQEKRGEFIDMKYFQNTQKISDSDKHTVRQSDFLTHRRSASSEFSENVQVALMYLVPLAEMIIDFFDRLKSITEGYASLDYEFFDYQSVQVVKVDILVNKEKVDALSFLAVENQAHRWGRDIVEKLAEVIPRQQFAIPIQAAIGGQIVARADVKPFRKDVIQKLYGGDRTRKDKLLDKQKKGKEKMKDIGRVSIPQTAFFQVLKKK